MALRRDDIGFGGYSLLQDDEAFCYGVDAVLLADLAHARQSDRVMDLCTGNGVIPLIIYAKYRPKSISGIEIQKSAYELAVKNAADNGLSEKISFFNMDALDVKKRFAAESFSLVCCNPPYTEKGHGIPGANESIHIARHETSAALSDFTAAAAWLLPNGGRFCMVHRPSRLADIMQCCREQGLEPKTLRMVAPHRGAAANIVLVECVKGGGRELKVLPELIVRNPDGSFTDEIEEIYCRK